MAALLHVDQVTRSFGGVYAVREVTLAVAPGELRGVIGPNGAGKSTLFNLIGGQLRADHGTLTYEDQRIDGLPPHRRARLGIAVVFQAARVFRGLTALENAMVGAHASTGAGFLAGALRLPVHRREEAEIRQRARDALARTGLSDLADRPAEALPLGQQRALQVARALCGRPRLLLLDEPASGLRAAERDALAALIEQLHADGLTMMLIEHDVGFVTRLADRVTVLDLGQVIGEGTPEEIRAQPRVVAAYLGAGGAGMTVIEVEDLVVRYDSATALDGVSLAVHETELVALIGPNGAGKSTLVNALSGFVRPARGTIRLRGRLAHVPEGRQVFAGLSVEDNLRLGAWGRRERDTSPVYEVLPGLVPLRRRPAGLLSGGEQQMVAIGRALMSRPDVLAVDELSLGLAPLVLADLVRHLRQLNADTGLALLLIEQNARLALGLCSRGYVLEAGRIVAEGSAAELSASPRVARAYLGGSVAAPTVREVQT